MGIGIIGFGEVGFEISKGLIEKENVEKIIGYDYFLNKSDSSLIQERFDTANVKAVMSIDEVVNDSNLLIIAVPADNTENVSESVIPLLKKKTIYVDVTTADPSIKKKIGEKVSRCGCYYVDAAMLGSLTIYLHRVPILASGNGANHFKEFGDRHGMDISVLNNRPGDASRIKLIRSIFTKGVSSLIFELLETSATFNLEKEVIQSLTKTFDNRKFEELFNTSIVGTSIHYKRRQKEVESIIKLQNNVNVDPIMTQAIIKKLEVVEQYNFKDALLQSEVKSWEEIRDVITN